MFITLIVRSTFPTRTASRALFGFFKTPSFDLLGPSQISPTLKQAIITLSNTYLLPVSSSFAHAVASPLRMLDVQLEVLHERD